MNQLQVDWPVGRAAVAVVSPSEVETAFRGQVTGSDQFQMASVTKLLTSLGALAAVSSGRIGLDDPVPEAVRAGAAEGVTLRHLLAHASGLPAEPGGRARRPEERRVYSHVGFRVLAEAVGDAAGMSFPAWLAASVLDPLGMERTRLGRWRGVDDDPAAGASSSLDDLTRLARCLLERGAPVVGPDLFAEATSVQFPGLAGLVPGVGRFDPCDWGLGFELHDAKRPHWMGDRRSEASFGHFGASGCFLWVDPQAGLAAAALTDRPFADDKWGMATWPAWSDRLAG
ncbi:MAG TPA: serine hydrolase domain-containing protein [Actinomycetes bacterium]|nr:serine hydrolase domain-containing protein [Actinomycetes bacterium]HEV3464654.1 serine hydrolase domain-containing protein [Actinomycetota bacterium]HEX2159612.1 serine hydrolase domain-containing protein [Actinomycetes bacterium]